jgi:hypothetical protein
MFPGTKTLPMKILSPISNIAMALFFAGLLTACGQDNAAKAPQDAAPTPVVDPIAASPSPAAAPQIQLDAFSQAEWPADINGCSCYFSRDKAAFEQQSYIYVDNFENLGFVSIDKKMVRLSLTKEHEMPEGQMRKTFANEQYTVTIDLKNVGQIDETWQKEGSITLKPSGGTETKITVYGECGC